MSAALPKPELTMSRQDEKPLKHQRRSAKKRFDTMMELDQYAYLDALATKYRTSMAKVLSAILRLRPEPDETSLR